MTQRSTKLVKPRFQLKVIGIFFFLACLSAAFQFVLFEMSLSELAPHLGEADEALLVLLREFFRDNLVLAFACLAPLMLVVGVLVTHRIAGPLHRIEQHLEALARGENPGECRIRKHDELQELCERINEAQRALVAARDSAALQSSRRAA